MADAAAGVGVEHGFPHAEGGEQARLLAVQEVELAPGLRHAELYTREGLLTLFWHGYPGADRVVLTCGGATGGVLGPAGGVFHDLGVWLERQGVATIRVGYRRPNDLDLCVQDMVTAAGLAAEQGADRAVTIGHSFGGAVAIRAAVELPDLVAGVATLATQSAGCEPAGLLAGRELLLLHGDRDRVLDVHASEMVRMIAGSGELVVLPGAGHLLTEAQGEVRRRLRRWIADVLG